MSKISIALCTYNGAKFLEEQLASFSRQTRLPDELIVCDDRSSDATVEIIEEFARAARFPVTIHVNETNLGSTKNFERAISLCTGDLIFLADHDDVWRDDKVERLAQIFEENSDVGLVFSNAEIIDDEGRLLDGTLWDVTFSEEERRTAHTKSMLDVLLWKNVVTGATAAFRSGIRELSLPILSGIPHLIHDGWIALIAAAGSRVHFVNEPLIRYRQHAGQQLGLGPSPDKLVHKGSAAYARSIAMLEREVERLGIMQRLTNEHPVLSRSRPVEPIDSIIARKADPLDHYRMRKNLPRSRVARAPRVLRELVSGRYGRHSRGVLSAIKDLFGSKT